MFEGCSEEHRNNMKEIESDHCSDLTFWRSKRLAIEVDIVKNSKSDNAVNLGFGRT